VTLGSARSLPELLLSRVEHDPDALAFAYPVEDEFSLMLWRQVRQRVFALAGSLLEMKLGRGQRCAILSSTRVEWILADLAIMCAGGATTTVYPASTAEECAYILRDSESQVVFVENDEQLAKVLEARPQLPQLKQIVLIAPTPSAPSATPATSKNATSSVAPVVTLDAFEAAGQHYVTQNPDAVETVARKLSPEDLATLIYTSGTTGEPKGVELTHDCWLAAAEAIDQLGIVDSHDLQYLWLPLSHSFGKVLVAAQLKVGFQTAIDGRIPMLLENLPRIRPTFMAAAPRIFEKMHNRIVSSVEQSGGLRFRIFRWAVHVGRQVSRLKQGGQPITGLLALQYRIADRLVFAQLRDRFGGRFRFFVSGSAPLSREIAEFFHAAGLLIIEGYGLTESSAVGASTSLVEYRFGTVGRAHGPVSIRIADDGELLLKGRPIMRGYHNRPELTSEVLDADGWFKTGDIAEFDAQGLLRITDRKKDLIKTSGGKYVAPQKLESRLKALCPYISNVLVHGNNRNFCSALITLDLESLAGWRSEHELALVKDEELAHNTEVVAMIQQAVDRLNGELSSYETIKKFAILGSDFTVESGELTPSLKVKRKVVEQRHRGILDGFYEGSVSSV